MTKLAVIVESHFDWGPNQLLLPSGGQLCKSNHSFTQQKSCNFIIIIFVFRCTNDQYCTDVTWMPSCYRFVLPFFQYLPVNEPTSTPLTRDQTFQVHGQDKHHQTQVMNLLLSKLAFNFLPPSNYFFSNVRYFGIIFRDSLLLVVIVGCAAAVSLSHVPGENCPVVNLWQIFFMYQINLILMDCLSNCHSFN